MIGNNGELDEDRLQVIRERKLAEFLIAEVQENDVAWNDFQFEETQAVLDIAECVLSDLEVEIVKILKKIK